ESCALHAPPQATPGARLVADAQQRDGVAPYVWTVREFCEGRMLPFAFADVGSMSQLEFLLQNVEERLHQLARDLPANQVTLAVDWEPPESADSQDARVAATARRIDEAEGLSFDALASGRKHKLR